jgi:ribosome-associated protein
MPVKDPQPDSDETPRGAAERPSRSQRKREVAAITQLGTRLVGLRAEQLDALELDEDLRDAIERCKTLQRVARNRQTKLIGKLLRARDHGEIRQALERIHD